MKINRIFLLLFIITNGFLFAQTGNLQVDFVQSDQSQRAEFNVSTTITTPIQNGFYLEWPENMKAVLKSVQVNDQQFWLKNEQGDPDRDNVAYWQSDDKGILLSFQIGALSNGDQLVLNFMPHNVQAVSDSAVVILKDVVDQGDRQKAPGQTLVSQDLNKPASE